MLDKLEPTVVQHARACKGRLIRPSRPMGPPGWAGTARLAEKVGWFRRLLAKVMGK